MSLPGNLIDELNRKLSDQFGSRTTIDDHVPVGGGSINDAWKLATRNGSFFLKTNLADRFPSMFEAEADGLERIRSTSTVRVPEVIAHGEVGETTYLLLEFITSGPRTPEFWQRLGRSLAHMHRHTSDHFGLERSNYIGSLEQPNPAHSEWSEFFIHARLEPQLRMARNSGRLGAGSVFRSERLFGNLNDLFPKEAPALLHGDLWSGNQMANADGFPVLFDPAVYYGHREMDLAMSRLFGGFDRTFYSSYQDEWPLEIGWEEREDLCNLYPLLVHVNLFGGGYVTQVEQILRRFS